MTISTLRKPRTAQRNAARSAALRDRDDLPFGSYARISKRKAGDGGGATIKMERQHEENRDTLEGVYGEGVAVVEYGDNMSAWNPDVVRHDWERMLRDLREGRLRGVIAWHADRFTRQPLQLEMLLEIVRKTRAALLTTRSGLITDPTMLRIEGALAAKESDQKSARVRLHHKGLAIDGKQHGGKRRWGYEPRMLAIRESEAVVIREAVNRLLAGETLSVIARDFRAREIPTAEGGQWTPQGLGTMLRKPAYAGLRAHVDPETDEVLLTSAVWPEIVERDRWERMMHLLSDPARRTSYTNATVHLLSGLGLCETCGGKLRGKWAMTRVSGVKRRIYACETNRHCLRSADQMDEIVRQRIVNRLERMRAAGMIAPSDPSHGEAAQLAATIADLKASADEVEASHKAGQIKTARYLTTVAGLDDEREICEARLRDLKAKAARPADVLEGMTGEGAAEAWERADLGRQRAIIDLLCTISLRGSNGDRKAARQPLQPRDVVIDWKEDD